MIRIRIESVAYVETEIKKVNHIISECSNLE